MFCGYHVVPVVVALALTTTIVTGDGCTLNLQTDIEPTREPLIIKQVDAGGEQFDIAWPRVECNDQAKKCQGIVDVEEGKEIIFSCPGPSSNVVRGVRSQTGVAKCTSGQLKFSNGKVADRDNISCSTRVAVSSVKNTQQSCAPPPTDKLPLQTEPLNTGTKFSIGFQVKIKGYDIFLPMSDVCHSIDDMWTYYVFHQLHGESLEGAVQCSGRKCFSKEPKKDGVFQGIDPEKAYSQAGQITTLDKILGAGAGNRYLTKDRVYLARGHLAPDADFIYYSGQLSTYYFINAAPQWQSFNNGNWKSIEFAVRKLAGQLKKTLNVWTGTQGIQKLKDNYGMMKNIYLVPWENKPKDEQKKSRLPVPQFYWKLVQDPSRSLCIVVVGYNDVHTAGGPELICDPVSNSGWPTRQEPGSGFIYYCNYESFKQKAYYIPKIDCKGILPFS